MRAVAALLLVVLAGCGLRAAEPQVSDRFCATRVDRMPTPVPFPSPGQSALLLAGGISPQAVETAEAIGAVDDLVAMLAAERRPAARVEWLAARLALRDRILLATLDIQTAMAGMDCAGERNEQLRGQLQRIEARRTLNLTLSGLAVGAVAATASGALSLAAAATASDAVAIGGALGEAGVAGWLLSGGQTGRMETRYNMLDEIWRRPENSTLFPPTVWRFLTRRDAPGEPNVAEEIIEEWRENGLIAPDAVAGEELELLRPSGRFDIGELEQRDQMMVAINVRVALMNRDLRLLLAEVLARANPLHPRRGMGP